MVNICVITLIGLPGAGKTTFCKDIIKCTSEYNIIHVCYDEIFHFCPESNKGTYKNERKKVAQKIESIIDEIKSNTYQKNEAPSNHSTYSVILVDDNNYYAGMRYEIYKICKANQLYFGQVYFPVDLNCALARNATRVQSPLPSYVIVKMNNRLESPSEKNLWERNTLVIHHSVEVQQFCSFLKKCFLHPAYSTIEKNDSKQNVSLVHEVDILLRKRIKELLENSKETLSTKANILIQKRKCILLEVKNCNLFDDSLNVNDICDRLTL